MNSSASCANVPRDVLVSEPGRLLELLKKHEIDIWFSVEGTWGDPKKPEILDGDLLSATGVEIAGNEVLLPPSTPAGLPTRGVDFGLDAIRTRRTSDRHAAITGLHFSTEILFWGDPTFTDGDVMGLSGSIIALNEDLVNPFQPGRRFPGPGCALWSAAQFRPRPHDHTHRQRICVGHRRRLRGAG